MELKTVLATFFFVLFSVSTAHAASEFQINDSIANAPGGETNASGIHFRTLVEFYASDIQSEDYNWSLTFLRNGQNYTITEEIVPASLLNGTNFTVVRQGQVGLFWFYVTAQTGENVSFLFVEHNMTADGTPTNVTFELNAPYYNATVNLTMLVGNITSFYVKPYFNDTSVATLHEYNKATYSLWQAITDELGNIGMAIILLPIIFGFILVALSYGLGEKQHFTLKSALILFAVLTILPTLWIGNIVVMYYNPEFADFTNALATLTMISGFICFAYVAYLLITTFIETLKYFNTKRTAKREEKYK